MTDVEPLNTEGRYGAPYQFSLASDLIYADVRCIDDVIIFLRYMWNASGNLMIAMAAFAPSDSSASVGDRTMAYSISNNLLEQGSDAIERILSSYKEVVELAGYSSRVRSEYSRSPQKHVTQQLT